MCFAWKSKFVWWPDNPGKGIALQYSIDDQNSWENITYFCPDGYQYPDNYWLNSTDTSYTCDNDFSRWNTYCYYIPPSTLNQNTYIRWYQEKHDYWDYWGLDNIFICSIPLNYAILYDWYENQELISNDSTTCFYTDSSTQLIGIWNQDTITLDINVNPLPNPVIIQTANVLSIGTYPSYQWYYNGDTIPGANNYFYSTYINGNYHVNVIDTNGCIGNSDTIFISISSVDEVGNNNTIKIYPNPVKDILTIESSQELNNDIKITDLSGRVLLIDKIKAKYVNLNVSSLEKGIYLLQISETNEVIRFTKR